MLRSIDVPGSEGRDPEPPGKESQVPGTSSGGGPAAVLHDRTLLAHSYL